MGITLRAHHTLCIQGFRGKGYSAEFVANFAAIVQELSRNKALPVKLLAEPDDICSHCPYLQAEGCYRNGKEAEKISQSMDKQVLSKLGLYPGIELPWANVIQLIKTRIAPKDLLDICKYCPWLSFGYCSEGIEKMQEGKN
jgi:hypothetical protein